MSQINAFRAFWDWCFDRKPNSPIPEPEILLKYNSPINSMFILRSLIRNAHLNHYLNKYLNNIGLYYIDQEELLHFTKKCIQDFKVKRKDIHFVSHQTRDILFEKLRKKLPYLKSYDVELLTKVIQKSDEKDAILSALNIEKPKKKKLKKIKQKKKIKLTKFLKESFRTTKMSMKL